jgi:spore coat-associated protein N
LASVTLTNTAATSSPLNTDTTNGLQMVIDKCSVAWTEGGTAPAYTYTCSGTTSSVLASTPVVGSNLAMSNLSALNGGHERSPAGRSARRVVHRWWTPVQLSLE